MAWTFEQQVRLQQERQIIDKYLYAFSPTWHYPTIPGEAYIEVKMRTNSYITYTLRLYIPRDLPNSVPQLFVYNSLKDYSNKDLSSLGVSAIMHTLGPKDGYVQICHYRPTNWTPNVTFYKVFMKARLWLEAYEGHLKTGKNLDHYLSAIWSLVKDGMAEKHHNLSGKNLKN